MSITLDAELEAALTAVAKGRGISMEDLARDALRERFVPKPNLPFEPQDEWERNLLKIGIDCGVSLSDEAVGREEMYD